MQIIIPNNLFFCFFFSIFFFSFFSFSFFFSFMLYFFSLFLFFDSVLFFFVFFLFSFLFSFFFLFSLFFFLFFPLFIGGDCRRGAPLSRGALGLSLLSLLGDPPQKIWYGPGGWGRGDGGGGEGEEGENSPGWKHRSSTPSGQLPCTPFNFKLNLLRQGTGTADHLMLLRLFFLMLVIFGHFWLF